MVVASVAVLYGAPAMAQSVRLDERDATVWSYEQVVRGEAAGTEAGGTLYVNGRTVAFTAGGTFEVPVRLDEGENVILACAPAGGEAVCSDTLRWTLGYDLRPELYAYATVDGRTVTLHGRLLENPDSAALVFTWRADPDNPQGVDLQVQADTLAAFTLPEGAAHGEYYVDLVATAGDGDEARARTFVTVDASGVTAFDITSDHAAWVDRAMIYEVTPYIIVPEGRFPDVTQRIPELVELGINTLWIQPVFGTHGRGQGYDITDYFAVRPDLGTEAELHELVDTAHEHGLRVLFDFVPNHTSVHHPYAQDAIAHGAASHYFDFYQRTRSNAPYSRHENEQTLGEMTFVHYFWEDLKTLNYDNPEVRRWMEEAGRYWIETFDIDGYRIDAVWGVNARTPEAMQQWRFALKRLKPEILLLGEQPAANPASFDNRFDAAFDWYYEEDWVSHWTWQREYSSTTSLTIFNGPINEDRSDLLREALTNRGDGYHPDAKVLRFMENNDIHRFIATHDLPRTKMAATLLYTLPGLPLLYNGQEIGYPRHPYETFSLFIKTRSIASQDRYGLFRHYQRLMELRQAHPALYSDHYEEVDVSPWFADDNVFAFRRWQGAENLFTVLNMGERDATVQLGIPVDRLDLDPATTYYLTDLLSGDYVAGRPDELPELNLPMPGYTARLYLLADHVAETPVAVAPPSPELPAEPTLAPNYPNPFNPVTTIAFTLPQAGPARLAVYDVLGREVAVLVDDDLPAGRHTVAFDGRHLASGLYLYRLTGTGPALERTMLLVK